MNGHRAAWTLVFAALPGSASAHAFSTGKDAYGAFLEGAGVILATPSLTLPLFALAVVVVLWRPGGLLRAWPLFILGQLAGLALAPVVGSWAVLMPLSFGVALGLLAAVVPIARIGDAVPVLAGLTGAAVMLAALEGHGWGELGMPIYLGLLFGANLATAAGAGLLHELRMRWPGQVTDIGLRIFGSWVAAILVLYLAFTLTGGPG